MLKSGAVFVNWGEDHLEVAESSSFRFCGRVPKVAGLENFQSGCTFTVCRRTVPSLKGLVVLSNFTPGLTPRANIVPPCGLEFVPFVPAC